MTFEGPFQVCGSMVKTPLDTAICTVMNVDSATNKLRLHTYFRIKAIRKRRLKSSLYSLPSCQGAFLWWLAALELVEQLLLEH